MAFKKQFLVLFLFGLMSGCSGGDDGKDTKVSANNSTQVARSELPGNLSTLPLPDITNQPLTLRVANVVNPRFKNLSDYQIQEILLRTQQLVKQHFKVEINFSDVEVLDIKDVFKTLKPNVIKERVNLIVDIDFISDEDREIMQSGIFKTLSNYSKDKQKVIDYAQPYLLHPEIQQTSFIDLSYALVDTLLARLQYWKKLKAADGKPIIDATKYNEWVWWDSLGYGDFPYEVVLTNQLVASAEYYDMDVHSSIRGGVSAGTTSYSRNALLSTYVYIMVYPMLNNTELLTTLRNDESYNETQIINYSAALLTHELGHMLLHLGHPFGDVSCIMSPTTMLNYRDWYDNLDSTKCAIGSRSEMVPGVVKIGYYRQW